jgi:hypothetical protein
VLEISAREPDLATINFYYSDDRTFYAFLTYNGTSGPVVEKIIIARGRAGVIEAERTE